MSKALYPVLRTLASRHSCNSIASFSSDSTGMYRKTFLSCKPFPLCFCQNITFSKSTENYFRNNKKAKRSTATIAVLENKKLLLNISVYRSTMRKIVNVWFYTAILRCLKPLSLPPFFVKFCWMSLIGLAWKSASMYLSSSLSAAHYFFMPKDLKFYSYLEETAESNCSSACAKAWVFLEWIESSLLDVTNSQ